MHSPETPPPQAPCQEPEQRVSRALVTNCLETYEDVVMTSRPSGFQGRLKEETPGGMQEVRLEGAAQAWGTTVTKSEGTQTVAVTAE